MVRVLGLGFFSVICAYCLNSLCSVNHSQSSAQIHSPYRTITACDRVTNVFTDRTLLCFA